EALHQFFDRLWLVARGRVRRDKLELGVVGRWFGSRHRVRSVLVREASECSPGVMKPDALARDLLTTRGSNVRWGGRGAVRSVPGHEGPLPRCPRPAARRGR